MSADLLEVLEHDHVPLSRAIAELTALLSRATGDPGVAEVRGPFSKGIREVRDQLIDHFGKEEQGLFPFLLERAPTLATEIGALSAAHDSICGAAVRLSVLADRDSGSFHKAFPLVLAVFARFEAAYTEHAKGEIAFLRRAQSTLSPAERETVAELAREL